MDDAVRIERLLSEQTPEWLEPRVSTVGAIALHINSNEHTDSEDSRAWVYFDAKWCVSWCGKSWALLPAAERISAFAGLLSEALASDVKVFSSIIGKVEQCTEQLLCAIAAAYLGVWGSYN